MKLQAAATCALLTLTAVALAPELRACHVAAKLHFEKTPAEQREARARELGARWMKINAEMDMQPIAYRLRGTQECQGGMADIFPCRSVDLLAHLPLSAIGGGAGNDIWGWTDAGSGREFALVGRTNGTAFVEISDPENPVFLGNLPTHTGESTWRDIKIYQDHAFIVSDNNPGHGMQVFDLSQLLNVSSPPNTFSNTAHYDDFSSAHNIVINEDSGFAYAVGGEDCAGGLHMINVQNPTSPVFAGCFQDDGYTHDAQCVNYKGPDTEHQGQEICFNSNEDTLTIVDVTDKLNPVQLSRTGYSNVGYAHQGWLNAAQTHFYLDDELDERVFGMNTRTLIWDLTDLDAPSVTVFMSPLPASDHNQYVHDGHLYQANYTAGLRILRLNPNSTLTEVAFFDTLPEQDDNRFSGAWSVYPFFASGSVIVSDINRGLFVLRPRLEPPPGLIFRDDFDSGDLVFWGP
ncbi:MAG: choice-of-anchor B family protein [Acidobacteriota bacterium]